MSEEKEGTPKIQLKVFSHKPSTFIQTETTSQRTDDQS
jgi:hypothetical protein